MTQVTTLLTRADTFKKTGRKGMMRLFIKQIQTPVKGLYVQYL